MNNGDLAIVDQPVSQTVVSGSPVNFQVRTNRDDVNYQWRRDGVALTSNANGATYVIAATEGSDAGTYSVMVELSDGSHVVESNVASLHVRDLREAKEHTIQRPDSSTEPGPDSVASGALEWDARFAGWTAASLTALLALISAPAWWAAIQRLPAFSGSAARTQRYGEYLVLIGISATVAAVYLVLLELRGRSRRPGRGEVASRGMIDSVAHVPEILRAFGALRAPAALLIVAITAFVCGTALMWHATPEGPSTPSSTTTTSVGG